MAKLHQHLIFIFFISFTIIDCFPCPTECICKSTGMIDKDFTRMSYIINCTNVILNDNKLIYHAESSSILEDKILDDKDDETMIDYSISIDLSNSSLKQFHNQTIQLTDFSFSIQSLSLTNQVEHFSIQSNAFNSSLYENLKLLNLSSCSKQIPSQCSQLLQPLKKLEILDLSGSNLYQNCLNTPDTFSSKLRDLILRNNHYDTNTFSHTSRFFDGVRTISGKLDLQNSYFNMSTQLEGNCLFDIFAAIKTLDLSSVTFYSISNDTEIHLTHLLKCKNQNHNGEQLHQLYLRHLNLQRLPEIITTDRFPRLTELDLSNNYIHSIDIHTFTALTSISLAYNPIELHNITGRPDPNYRSLDLRSTIQNRTFNLTTRLVDLFKLSTNIDYSENLGNIFYNLTNFPIEIGFSKICLNLSKTNLYSFEINAMSAFDDLDRLDINSNSLTQLNLERQLKLSYLDCSNQKLRSLKFPKDSSKLIEFQCSNNSLKTIENLSFSTHHNLKLIDLSYNSIESLDDLFSNLNNPYLHTILLQSNSIEKISSKMFSEKLISLYSIDLSWNKINTIQANAFQSPNLQILDLTGNPLKNLQTKFLFTSSLRLFYLINHTQQLIDRCAQSTTNDILLGTYLTWFTQNGTYMKTTQTEKSQQIQFDKCLLRYTSRSKVKYMKIHEEYHIKHLSLYVTIAAITVGILLGIIYLYKKNQWTFLTSLQRYRPLDRNSLVENTDEISQHQREDDEIVMNLNEPPFNTIHQA